MNARKWPVRSAIELAVLILLALSTLLPWQTAGAADVTVTTTTDVLDAGGGDCGAITIPFHPGPDGVISLREAMCAANNTAGPDTIQFDIPSCESGCTIQPTVALPVLTDDGTTIDGYTQEGASPATAAVSATLLIEIDGSNIANNNGFNVASGGNVIRGLAINRFVWNGIAIGTGEATGNVISGNYIGTDLAGSVDLGNGLDGVFVGLGAQNNTIGGDEDAERNVISGNDWDGVALHGGGTMSNTVSGNYIGVAADGRDDCANGLHGVYVYGGAQNNIIGGNVAGEGNVISGNDGNGVRIHGGPTAGNAVSGNLIGVDASGLIAVLNNACGVSLEAGARDNLVGGDDPTGRNVISGNASHGISLDHAGHNRIAGNFVGLDASGLAALPNGGVGVLLTESAQGNTIGGESIYEANFISGNDTGIWIEGVGTSGNVVRGNVIGSAMDLEPLGNTWDGVHLLFGAQHNTIGPANYILFNGDDGVGVDSPGALGNTITQNHIFANGGLGIHLTNSAHNDIAAPIIWSAPGGPGDITGTACPGCTVEVFANIDDDGEGMAYLASAVAGGGGDFALTVPFLPFPYLTATATDADDGTSEFSAVFTANIPVLAFASRKSADRETVSPGAVMTYTITLSNTGTWHAKARLTDTLPAEVTWADRYGASAGSLTWEEGNNRLLWGGEVGLSAPVVITYQVTVNEGLPNGERISNSATVNNGAGFVFDIYAPHVTVIAYYLYLPLVLK